jgi:chorismate synthase
MSLPASKGFEIGSGFGGTLLSGFDHNDEFYIDENGRTRTKTNRSGGIQGGISNGENIVIRVAFKPTSTIGQEQKTVTREGEETTLRLEDICIYPWFMWLCLDVNLCHGSGVYARCVCTTS